DIVLPSAIDAATVGESNRDRALPWDQIAATDYKARQPLGGAIRELTKYEATQLADDPDLRYLKASIAAADEARAVTHVSLNLEVRKQERETQRKAALQRENTWRTARGMKTVTSVDDIKPEDEPDPLLETAANMTLEFSRLSQPANAVATQAATRPKASQERATLVD
ncbi:MAG: hypothetical protein DYH20_12485, partial [Gammaproteobacteria bacterium PRO9]|nr:hypothetical protein [Gammaproteobacteria bacterium PRO9]